MKERKIGVDLFQTNLLPLQNLPDPGDPRLLAGFHEDSPDFFDLPILQAVGFEKEINSFQEIGCLDELADAVKKSSKYVDQGIDRVLIRLLFFFQNQNLKKDVRDIECKNAGQPRLRRLFSTPPLRPR